MTRQRAKLVSSKMVLLRRKEWVFDTPEQCRQRRRRRIEIRRARWSISGHYYLPARPHQSNNSDHHDHTCLLSDYVQQRQQNHNNINLNSEAEEEEDGTETETESLGQTDHAVVVKPAVLVPRYSLHQNPMPEFGMISLIRSPDQIQISMENYATVLVKEDFCRLEFDDVVGPQPLHFFAVYDGHGHPHVSTLCKQRMHQFVEEELMREQGEQEGAPWPDLVRTALERSFMRMHRQALDTCSCGNIGHTCGCKPNINALPVAGSTAVVAILTAQHVVIANCGSTHAVLGRAGSPFLLSNDHKPERLDEQERMRAVDGRVSYPNGVRVYGILNMSHSSSPGDHHILKPVVTLEPQISFIKREAEQDECLILADNGLWDVMSDDMACRVACTCLRDGGGTNPITTDPREYCVDCHSNTDYIDETGTMFLSSKSHHAATVLCRLALARGSNDDMSVVVVDLKSG